MWSPTATMPTRCCTTRLRPTTSIFWFPRWWNKKMCMACEEMQLFYAYLDAVEEAKRKAQPWECEVTVFPQGDAPAAEASPAPAAKPVKAAKRPASEFSCD